MWGWLIVAVVLIAAASNSSEPESSPDLRTDSQEEASTTSEATSTTTTTLYRYEPSDDPIENLLWVANEATYELRGWELLGRTFTDDDMTYDDIRIDVVDRVDYKSFRDTADLIDVALAIMDRAMAPIQIDFRISVEHSEVQPDGSIEVEGIRREWIELTGDSESSSGTVDVYGFEPAETSRMKELQLELRNRFPNLLIKTTDTSRFDD